jgi:hypothetical protein
MRPFSSIAALLLLGPTSGALVSTPPVTQAPPRCDTPQYRQFDFWVGDWTVTSGGRPAGTNHVTLEEAGCLVHEHWTGARGGTGQSFNFFDRTDSLWHQVWVSSSGTVLFLSGKYSDGRLAYTAQGQRLTFFHNADGTVRQLWESSSDGKQWSTVFDGMYVKRAP